MATVYIGRPGSFSVNADEGTATPEVLWTQNAIKQALIDTSGKSFNDMAARLNAIDAAISAKAAQGDLTAQLTDMAVSVKAHGAIGDGIADDTAAIKYCLANFKNVYVPPGTYKITSTLFVDTNTRIFGAKENTILQIVGSFNVFELGFRATVEGFRVFLDYGSTFNDSIFAINDRTLRNWVSDGNGGMRILVHDVLVKYWKAGKHSAIISLSLENPIAGNGFYDVTFDNVRSTGAEMGYFLRSWCTDANYWINGVTLDNCVTQGQKVVCIRWEDRR
jgi:hypothetical protein